MTLTEYIAGIEKVSGHPVGPEGSPRWVKLAERYAECLRAIQDRTPNLLEQGIQYTDNRVSRALFTAETGIVLPKTQRDSVKVLREYAGADRVDAADRAKEQAEAERKADAERRRLAGIVERFRAGQDVTGAELVDGARACGHNPHPRTVGMVRDKVITLNREGVGRIRGTVSGDTIGDMIARILRPHVVNEFYPTAEEQAEITRVFAPQTTDDDTAGMSAGELAAAESLFRPGGTLAYAG